MVRSGTTGSIYAKGIRDSSGNIVTADCMSPRTYDAIVDSAGCGDYTLPSAAFTAGAKSVFVRTGIYTETVNVTIPGGGCLIGEEAGGSIINFSGSVGITADGNGGTIESAGTVSITTDTQALAGVGTTFTNMSSGDYVFLGDEFYEIDTITDATNLTLIDTYRGETLSANAAWFGQTMLTGISIVGLSVTGSTTNNIFLRAVRHGFIREVITMNATGDNIHLEDCAFVSLHSTVSEHSGAVGINFDNSISCHLTSCTSKNNVSHGLQLENNSTSIIIDGSAFVNNGDRGVFITTGSTRITLTDCLASYNDEKGLETTPTAGTCTMTSCTASNNGSDGIDYDGAGNVAVACIVENNGEYGIQTGDDGVVTGCYVADNTLSGIRVDSDVDTSVTGNVSTNNGAHGIIVENSDQCVIVGNRCDDNGDEGIHVDVAAADKNVVCANIALDNTNSNITNSGTNTVIGHNLDDSTTSGDPHVHAAAHVDGGNDEIDGDLIDITFTPSNYTPDATPVEANDVDDLAAHLAGIDNAITGGGAGGWTDDGATVRLTTITDNVGIGTTSPNGKLDVTGAGGGADVTSIVDINDAASGDAYHRLVESNYRGGYIRYGNTNGDLEIGTHEADDSTLGNDISAIRVERSTGNVGIGGGIDPEGQLDVDGEILVAEIAAPGTPSTGKGVIYEQTDGILYFKDDGGNAFLISPSRFQTIKTTNTQDINTGTPVIITFDANEFISSDYSHTATSGNITINTTGTYKISYQINFDGVSARRTPRCAAYVNGTINNATIAYDYTRNSTDDKGTCSLPGYELSLTAADVVTIRGDQQGTAGTANTNLNECWVRIERVT